MVTPRIVPASLLVVVLWAALPPAAPAQGMHTDFLRTNPRFLEAFREAVADASKSTVRVCSDHKDVALGVVVGADGFILTKAYDLKGKLTCRLPDGRELDATVVGVHTVHDLALLHVEAGDLPAVTFKTSTVVAAGSWVASVGTEVDPVAVGVVSVPTRKVVLKGLPLAAAELARIGYLGVGLEAADGQGVRITQVLPGTPAAKAGLRMHDVITAIAGATVNDPEQFQAQLAKRKPGDAVRLEVQRDGETLDVEATLGQRPAGDNRGELQNHMGSTLSARRSGYPVILTHDSVVRPTDCGGPLVDLDGHIVGINISRAGRTESWAIPSEVIRGLLDDLRSGKLAPQTASGGR